MEIKCEWNTCLGSIRVCEALNIWHTAANEGLLKPERSSENLTAPQNPSKPSFRISDDDNRTSWTNKHPAIHLHTRGNHNFTQKWNAFLSTCFFPAREIKSPDVQINTLIITRVKTVTLNWQCEAWFVESHFLISKCSESLQVCRKRRLTSWKLVFTENQYFMNAT